MWGWLGGIAVGKKYFASFKHENVSIFLHFRIISQILKLYILKYKKMKENEHVFSKKRKEKRML